jgi:hypothetical protein
MRNEHHARNGEAEGHWFHEGREKLEVHRIEKMVEIVGKFSKVHSG